MLKSKNTVGVNRKGYDNKVQRNVIIKNDIFFEGNMKDITINAQVYYLDNDEQITSEYINIKLDFDNLPNEVKTVITGLYDRANALVLSRFTAQSDNKFVKDDFRAIPHNKVNKDSKDEEV